jgi:S-adenosylmethionine-diacylgycerolhomoserine-N-methlytransferase
MPPQAHAPPAEAARVTAYYRWMSSVYDATRWAFLFHRSLAVRSLGLQPGERVLEIGAGTGHNLVRLAQSVGPLGRAVGLDLSRAMLRRARRKVQRNGLPSACAVAAEATCLPFGRAFDAVLFSYSLSMIPDRDAALDRAVSVLRPDGGRLCVLDFGGFGGWGFAGSLARRWLSLNHVRIRPDDPSAVTARLRTFSLTQWMGGYCYLAVGHV